MESFLSRTPRLKTPTIKRTRTTYKAEGLGNVLDWDLCGFFAAIQDHVGDTLETLSMDTANAITSVSPSKLSMDGFQRLRILKLYLHTKIHGLEVAASDGSRYLPPLTDTACICDRTVLSRIWVREACERSPDVIWRFCCCFTSPAAASQGNPSELRSGFRL